MGQYGKIGSRRSRGGGGLQWMLIGFFPGLLCGGLVVFALLLSGTLGNFGEDPEPIVQTQIVQIPQLITTTPQAPVVVTATTAPTNTPSTDSQVLVPTSTPTQGVVAQTAPTNTPTQVEAAVNVNPSPSTDAQNDAQSGGSDINSADTSTGSNNDIPLALQSVGSQMVQIAGGTFEMGTTLTEIAEAAADCVSRDGGQCDPSYGTDSTPIVRVTLDEYQMEVNEVTFQQYVAFLNWLASQGQSHRTACFGFMCIQTTNENSVNAVITFDSANYSAPQGLLNHPVYGVTWYGAKAYCEALGRRLPTEAEWEHAARTGAGFIYPWGDNWNETLANTRVPLDQAPGTFPIDSYPSNVNAFGLRQMAGNVEEWVEDWYDANYYSFLADQQPVLNPQGPPTGTQKVLRGGSWNAMPFFARTVHRRAYFPIPDSPNDDYPRTVGFRCAADSAQQASVPADNTSVSVPADGSAATNNTQPTLGTSSEESQQETSSAGDRG